MRMESLQDLLMDSLKDLYDAEHQLTQALPKMAEAARSKDLKAAFEQHLAQTEGQINRLERVFQMMDKKPSRKTCKAMLGLVDEGKEIMKQNMDDDVKDAGLIAAAQKVEHYEIASYGTARTYARMLNHGDVAELLQQTLNEESETDKRLTQLAEDQINIRAAR